MEVSRSSIHRDRDVKAPLYAQGNADEYRVITMARFPDVRVAVADLLPPGEIAIVA